MRSHAVKSVLLYDWPRVAVWVCMTLVAIAIPFLMVWLTTKFGFFVPSIALTGVVLTIFSVARGQGILSACGIALAGSALPIHVLGAENFAFLCAAAGSVIWLLAILKSIPDSILHRKI